MWPAGRIALRSLMEIPITFDSPPCIFNSSPTVLTSRRAATSRAICIRADQLGGRIGNAGNCLPVRRSYHSLPMIPLMDGVAPVKKVSMAHGGYSGRVQIMGVGEHRAVIQHAREARM